MSKQETDAIEIKKISIKIGDKEISLKPDELRKLKSVIDELLGAKAVFEVTLPSRPYPIWYYAHPSPIRTDPVLPWITCCSTSGGEGTLSMVYNGPEVPVR